MSFASSAELLVLHAVRIQGMSDAGAIARRFSLEHVEVDEHLLDLEASGLAQRVQFADIRGWSLTESGRARGEVLLADELERAGARDAVEAAHSAFRPLNARFLDAITRWQLRPTPWDRQAANDHSDWGWDERVLADLASLSRRLRTVEQPLSQALMRFAGYVDRLEAALARVGRGERVWVDGPRIASCHTVWFELHEDLIATLGLRRGTDG